MSTINLFDDEILFKIIELIESKNQYKIREVLDRFPFTRLEDVDGSDLRILTVISRILRTFLCSNLFLQDEEKVLHSLKFVLSNLHFLCKQGEYQEATIILLDTLLHFLGRFNDVDCNINFDSFFELIISFTTVTGLVNKTIREYICGVFMQVGNLAEKGNLYVVRSKFFVECFTNLLSYVEGDTHLSFEVVNKLVAILGEKWNNYDSLKYFLEISMQKINKETEPRTIFVSVNLLQNIFKHGLDAAHCKIVVANLLKKFDLFLKHTRTLRRKDVAIEVFTYAINFVFIDAPWKPEVLRSQLNELLMCSSFDLIDNDIIYVIYYIEFLYCNYKHDRHRMAIKILRKLFQLPTDLKHTAFIKTMLLLYSVYVAPRCADEDEEACICLLNAVKGHPYISRLLTYHRSQLLFILHKGDEELKIKVLENWLVHHDNIDDIVKFVNVCNASKLFVNIALLSSCRDKCGQILSKLKHPPQRIWLYLGLAASKQNLDVLKYIFKANPAIPSNKKLAASLSNNLSIVLCCIGDSETLELCLKFCLKMLHKSGNGFEYAKPFYSRKIASFLWHLAISSKQSLSQIAIVFLRKLIELQELRAYKCETPVEIKFTNAVGSLSNVKDMLHLLRKILQSNNVNLILRVKPPAIDLYFYLLKRRNSIPKVLLYSVITLLIKNHRCLTASSHKQLINICDKSCYQNDHARSNTCKG